MYRRQGADVGKSLDVVSNRLELSVWAVEFVGVVVFFFTPSFRILACAPLLWARVMRGVIAHDCMDACGRGGDSLVRTPQESAVQGFRVHIDYCSNRGPQSVMLPGFCGQFEVVYVGNQQ